MMTAYNVGREAVRYVREQMNVKASNRIGDNVSAAAFDVAEGTKNGYEELLEGLDGITESMIEPLAWACVAQHSHIANCLGMASLAFAYIVKNHPTMRPVGVYGFTGAYNEEMRDVRDNTPAPRVRSAIKNELIEPNRIEGGYIDGKRVTIRNFYADHAVCIIGDPQLHNQRMQNDSVVFCDPWAKRTYYGFDLQEESALLASVTAGTTKLTCVTLMPIDGNIPVAALELMLLV